jgi:hypothetical protein
MLFLFNSGNKEQNPKGVENKTEIIDYEQNFVPTESKNGSCWTGSNIASSNPKAYRCTVGHDLYDPCFETEDKKVICGITPLSDKYGFELRLTEPLPDNSARAKKDSGLSSWIVKLDNDVVCMKLSGTAGDIPRADGKMGDLYFYTCDDNSVIVGYIDTTESVWSVRTTFIKQSGSEYIVHKVIKAWR